MRPVNESSRANITTEQIYVIPFDAPAKLSEREKVHWLVVVVVAGGGSQWVLLAQWHCRQQHSEGTVALQIVRAQWHSRQHSEGTVALQMCML